MSLSVNHLVYLEHISLNLNLLEHIAQQRAKPSRHNALIILNKQAGEAHWHYLEKAYLL